MSKSIKDLLPVILNQKNDWRIRLLSNWNTIWGSLSSKVHLERIEQHQLTIGVHDSCWMHELYTLSDLLLHAINKAIGSDQIKKLRFKHVEQKTKTPTVPSRPQPYTSALKPIILNAKEQGALNRIKDPSLSSALREFLIRCYREK